MKQDDVVESLVENTDLRDATSAGGAAPLPEQGAPASSK
jgi:hypothetical protein